MQEAFANPFFAHDDTVPTTGITPAMQFSIIIPLEFHRGQALECMEAWARGQSMARTRYQLLIAAPENYPVEDEERVRRLLSPQDRLQRYPFRHDMALVAAAAKEAQSDVLLFTESHAQPEPATLERVAQVLAERPEWDGFSFRSVPVTH